LTGWTFTSSIAGGVPDDVRADHLACYNGDRFVESMRYVRRYPKELPVLARLLPQLAVRRSPVTGAGGAVSRALRRPR
jgi:hypothetical protein